MKIRTTCRAELRPGHSVPRGTELTAGAEISEPLARLLVRLRMAVEIEAPAAAPVAPAPLATVEDAPNRMIAEDAAPVRTRAPRKSTRKAAE